MTELIQAVRGMNDILPTETWLWQKTEQIIRNILQGYGYQEIRFPIVEKTALFKRSIGEVTDIVEKEMYTFRDRNDESLTLRPEGTACCVRAGIEHGLLYNQIQRLWYMGPYFRHERPQKGRYRQFSQCGAEVFGLPGPDIDAELILMSACLLKDLGILPLVRLELNTLGTPEARQNYREALVSYLQAHQSSLDEDSLRRLSTNPLRVLDSKNPALIPVIEKAPKLIEYLDADADQHFAKLQNFLTALDIPFTINPRLVRGLDYYTKTVFEWTTQQLGAQGTVCAGGRYDALVEQLGGKPTPALGFAIGLERTILLMQQQQTIENNRLHIYMISDSERTFLAALKLANQLRTALPTLRMINHMGGGSIKNQLKKADKSGARFALILGEEELNNQCSTLKPLRENMPQKSLQQASLIAYLQQQIEED